MHSFNRRGPDGVQISTLAADPGNIYVFSGIGGEEVELTPGQARWLVGALSGWLSDRETTEKPSLPSRRQEG